MTPLFSILDHLVYAAPDLDAAIEQVAQLLGVRAAIGGQHPGWGTKNALLALGPKSYLEIMGPDPDQPEPKQPRPFGMDTMSKPRLVSWVARTDNIASVIDSAKQQSLDLGELLSKSRRKPDGSELKWTMTDLTKSRLDGMIPYFINWGDSAHPAESSPKGCRLVKLDLTHPDFQRVNEVLKYLGLDIQARRGAVGLKATIESPWGQVFLE
jgi:hypothetical protein